MSAAWTPTVLGRALDAAASTRGEADAIVCDAMRLDWRTLRERVRTTARAMLALGIGPGERVGILRGNDERWLEVFYAAALIGAVTVPVNTRFKAAELAHCLRESECTSLFMVGSFLRIDFIAMLREVLPEVDSGLPGERLPHLERVVIDRAGSRRGPGGAGGISVAACPGGAPDPAGGGAVPPAALDADFFLALAAQVSEAALDERARRVSAADLLLIQFTSGTTAFPKGVMLTHDNMLRNAWAAGQRVGIRSDDRYFNCRPLFHVGGSTLSALMALMVGACLVTLPTFEAGAALEAMARERCTLTSGNDTLFQMMMGHPTFSRDRLCLRGGWCAAGPETVRRIMDEMGAEAICVAYGLSESSPNVAMSHWQDPREQRIAGRARPLDGLEVRIADTDTGEEALPPLAAGEIQVRGWAVMRGYCNNPEATARTFTREGWLRTGDLGTVGKDGCLQMIGRFKDVFRVGGENVAPAEVEEVLLAHPAIATAQVVGVPDARLGEVAAAYVSLRAGANVQPDDLIEWTRSRCANFRVPRYLRIVADFESIGMTASGKVRKTDLRAHALRELGLAT